MQVFAAGVQQEASSWCRKESDTVRERHSYYCTIDTATVINGSCRYIPQYHHNKQPSASAANQDSEVLWQKAARYNCYQVPTMAASYRPTKQQNRHSETSCSAAPTQPPHYCTTGPFFYLRVENSNNSRDSGHHNRLGPRWHLLHPPETRKISFEHVSTLRQIAEFTGQHAGDGSGAETFGHMNAERG